MDKDTEDPRIGELEDKLKAAERRADDMRKERDEARELSSRMEENVKEAREVIEAWVEAFDMVRGDDGKYKITGEHVIDLYTEQVETYDDLVRRWNKIVPRYNVAIRQNP